MSISAEHNTTYVADRPFNDFRYALNSDKLKSLGWSRKHNLEDSIGNILSWYKANIDRYEGLFSSARELVAIAGD